MLNVDCFPLPEVYGDKLHEAKVAFLGTGNHIGFEILEFVKPKHDGPTSTIPFSTDLWTRGGFFHICVTAANPDELAREIVSAGGERIGETVKLRNEQAAL